MTSNQFMATSGCSNIAGRYVVQQPVSVRRLGLWRFALARGRGPWEVRDQMA